MAPPTIHIEWNDLPDMWMCNAAVVFHAALRHQVSQENLESSGDGFIFHISVLRGEKGRTAQYAVDEPEILMVAQPMVTKASKKPVLQTRCGWALTVSKRTSKLLIAIGTLIMVLFTYDPGAKNHKVHHAKTDQKVDVHKMHPATVLALCILESSALWLVLHTVSLQLLKECAKSLECVAITIFGWICEFVIRAQRVHLYPRPLTTYEIALEIVNMLTVVIGTGTIAGMDAWMMSNRSKAALILIFVATLVYRYTYYRWWHSWPNIENCYWSSCTTLQDVYLGSASNQLFFAMKILIAYCRSCRFAVLKANVADLDSQPFNIIKLLKKMRLIPDGWFGNAGLVKEGSLCLGISSTEMRRVSRIRFKITDESEMESQDMTQVNKMNLAHDDTSVLQNFESCSLDDDKVDTEIRNSVDFDIQSPRGVTEPRGTSGV